MLMWRVDYSALLVACRSSRCVCIQFMPVFSIIKDSYHILILMQFFLVRRGWNPVSFERVVQRSFWWFFSCKRFSLDWLSRRVCGIRAVEEEDLRRLNWWWRAFNVLFSRTCSGFFFVVDSAYSILSLSHRHHHRRVFNLQPAFLFFQ